MANDRAVIATAGQFLRARGVYASGTYNGSGSIAQSVRAAYLIPCFFNVSPSAVTHGPGAGTFPLDVTAFNQGCAWTAQSNAPWLTLTGNYEGSQTISYQIAANPGPQRTGTLTVANSTITITQTGNCPAITVNPANPTLPAGQTGQAYSQLFTQVGSAGAVQWSVLGSLPTGLSLNANTGLLSGTPTAAGDFNFTIKASDSNGCFGQRAYALHINQSCPGITVNPATVPNATVNAPYTQTFTQTGAVGTATFSLAGTLPNGLSFNAGTATLAGTATQAGSFNFNVTATGANNCQGTRNYTLTVNPAPQQAKAKKGDFDGDGKTDLAVWRPSDGNWYVIQSSNNVAQNTAWGAGWAPYFDVPVPGDYDGDGRTDHAIWRGSDSIWYIRKSSDGGAILDLWGTNYAPYFDIPTPGDFDGDGKIDLAVWRPTNGTFYVKRSSDGTVVIQQHGQQGDTPVAADCDGDGKTDFAVWRGSDTNWYILNSSGGSQTISWGAGYAPYFDVPVPADYDGDGKADAALWRGGNSIWYIRPSATPANPILQLWGASYDPYYDVPTPGDYDGDGKADIAVWRPTNGTFYVIRSTDGVNLIQAQGQTGDTLVPAYGVR